MGAKISQSVAGECHIKLGKKLLRLEPIGLVSIRINFGSIRACKCGHSCEDFLYFPVINGSFIIKGSHRVSGNPLDC